MKEVHVRVPLRICLAGGGTDLPVYYMHHGGLVISAGINKHIYIKVSDITRPRYKGAKYIVLTKDYSYCGDKLDEITHGIIRECLRRYESPDNLNIAITVTGDVPGGTGLGSSGALTVGLLRALDAFYMRTHRTMTARYLAETAYNIERFYLGQPVGVQDQYMAAFGGPVRVLSIAQNGTVNTHNILADSSAELKKRLFLFSTGITRKASDILARQDKVDNVNNINRLKEIHEIAEMSLGALTLRDLDAFGSLMDAHWEAKKQIDPAMTTPEIDLAYRDAILARALGGKVVGAGGGGFLLFYTHYPEYLREAMKKHNMPELPFKFSNKGAEITWEK
jgi:D-glycero-alpha-D-manno-heptose-7-phosphate kinase